MFSDLSDSMEFYSILQNASSSGKTRVANGTSALDFHVLTKTSMDFEPMVTTPLRTCLEL